MAEPDYGIALQVKPPQVAAGGNAFDPLGAIEKAARIQNEINTSRGFEAQFQARQQLGQLYAVYGHDPDLLASQIAQSPASAYFPEAFTQARSAALLGTQQAGARQEMSGNLMKDWGMSMGSLYANPTLETWTSLKNAALARSFDPKVKAAVSEQMDALGTAMFAGTGGDVEKVRQNIIANGIHFGMSPEVVTTLMGPTSLVDVGSGKQPFRGPSPVFGGSGGPLGPVIPQGLPPQPITGPTTIMPAAPGGMQFPVNPPRPGETPSNALSPVPAPTAPAAPASTTAPAPTAPASGAPTTPAPTGGAQPGVTYGTGLDTRKEREKDMANYEQTLDTKVNTGATLYKNIEEIYNEAKKAHLGGGASAYMALGRSLQALGVKNDTVDAWANGSLAASQVIDKISLNNATSQMRVNLEGAGRYNRNEFVAFLQSNPNLLTDPRAMVEVFNLWNGYYQRDKAEQTALAGAKKQPGFDMNNWPEQWQNSDYMKKFASGAPFTGEGVLGVLPEKARDGVFLPRNKKELEEIPKGQRFRTPGMREDQYQIR